MEKALDEAETMFQYKQFGHNDIEVVCYVPPENLADSKIAIPDAMLEKLVQWLHLRVSHSVGVKRTMSEHLYHDRLSDAIKKSRKPPVWRTTTITNLLEIYRIQETSAYHVGQQFVNGGLSRYPMPLRCVHATGPL